MIAFIHKSASIAQILKIKGNEGAINPRILVSDLIEITIFHYFHCLITNTPVYISLNETCVITVGIFVYIPLSDTVDTAT